jgi:hypothetical protein
MKIRKVINSLLDEISPKVVVESINQYINFNSYTCRPSIYENYKYCSTRLAYLCFYKYTAQIFVQTVKATRNRLFCFPFDITYLLHAIYIQVSVSSSKSLKTLSLYSSFISISEKENDILDTILQTQDKIHEVLLGLFYL